MSRLKAWHDKTDRKPLVFLGAKQVGKTWILKEFGKRCYSNVAYINCDNNPQVSNLFAADYNMERIIMTISAITSQTVTPGKTLIFLDEIQEAPRGLASLKYFCENARDYHVAVAGGLPGIQIHQGESFPAGKVDTLTMYPMDFTEFLMAKGEARCAEILQSQDWAAIAGLKSRYAQLLRECYFVGGMPEAVAKFVEAKDPNAVRKIQQEILEAYTRDVAEHAPANDVVRINQVWRSIPSQLAKENKKFIYGAIRKGARAKEFELAIQWLLDAGLVYKVPRVSAPAIPLFSYEDISSFKLCMLDCGLFGAMSNTPPAILLLPNSMKGSKGAFTENFVCTQMEIIRDTTIAYYSREDSQLEIDLMVQLSDMVIPIEVKAEENLRSKSLRTFLKAHPGMHGLRFSMSDYREQESLTNVPLYAAGTYVKLLKARRDRELNDMLSATII